jgi:hypothetical protein
MDIEVLATTAVKNAISWTERLVSYIPEKDKEPIWDGSVHVYASALKSNENEIGRVPTQVKGKAVNKFSTHEHFDVPVCELKNYLHEGGVIFFVVELLKTTEEKKIFYISLLPYDLIKLIESAGQRISKRIELNPFPQDNSEKEAIFANFLCARNMQRSLNSLERIIPVEEFIEKGYPMNLSTSFIKSKPEKDLLDCFIENGVYVYFNTPVGVTLPVDHITNVEMVAVTVQENISCQGRTFYSNFRKTRNKNGYEITIGNSFHFLTGNDKKTTSIKIKLAGTLKQRILDCEFVTAVFQNNGFYIGEESIHIDPTKFDKNAFESWQSCLAYLKSVKNALDYLGVIPDLDCDKATDEDNRKIRNYLLPAAEGRPIKVESFNEKCKPAILTICNLNILIMAIRQSDGRYILNNFFAENGAFVLKAGDSPMIPSSCYVTLDKNDFIILSNLDYDHMAKNMKMDSPHHLYCEKVNVVVLKLLAAYDETSRPEILHTALELTEWLCLNNANEIVYKLNLLQSIKRKRELNADERHWLLSLVAEQGVNDVIKMGAFILLEEYSEAEIYYSGLAQETKEEYNEYPIMALWKH